MSRGAKTALVWGVLVLIVLVAIFHHGHEAQPADASADDATDLIDSGKVRGYRTSDRGLLLLLADGESLTVPLAQSASVVQQLSAAHVAYEPEHNDSMFPDILLWVLGPLLALGAVYYFLKKSRGNSFNSIFELRKTKARPVDDADKAQFTDIGGNRQAVELLADIVDFLRAPERWTAAGLRVPRGVLVVGPPGTGKTLLARAVAGETKSAFFYTSAAEFVELFVGIGAARVRDTFEKAAAKQPAVVFIDELDAIGRRRGSGVGTMHEEREQTLNQLLVLLDGMERHKRLVVMAATNRPDILDPALLRSGRFDRVLRLELPTTPERLEILKIHTRAKPLDPDVSLDRIVGQTENFSGADVEALVNAAGLLALRRTRAAGNGNHQAITLTGDDFERARDEMTRSNRVFDRLDSLLVESVSQFAEPTGRALARVTLAAGTILEGEVLWMNAKHIKLRLGDNSEVVVVKDSVVQIVTLKGTETAPPGDFTPDRWAGRDLATG